MEAFIGNRELSPSVNRRCSHVWSVGRYWASPVHLQTSSEPCPNHANSKQNVILNQVGLTLATRVIHSHHLQVITMDLVGLPKSSNSQQSGPPRMSHQLPWIKDLVDGRKWINMIPNSWMVSFVKIDYLVPPIIGNLHVIRMVIIVVKSNLK